MLPIKFVPQNFKFLISLSLVFLTFLFAQATNGPGDNIIFDDCEEARLSELGQAINAFDGSEESQLRLDAARTAVGSMMAGMVAEVEECCEVNSGSDDAEEISGNGAYSDTDTNIGLGSGAAGPVSGQTLSAFRFDCYNIPQGATILSAYIQFTAAAPSTRGASFKIFGEDSDDCPTYSAANPPSARPTTSAGVPWSPPTWVNVGDALAAQQTPDLSSIVQEIVNRPGYALGNAFCFGIVGKGHRRTYSFDSGLGAPELCITYEVPEEITACDGCPNVTLASLDGVPGFPIVNNLNVCSEPDTISLLIYNNGICDLSNVQVELQLDAGLTYGGCVMNHNPDGVTADEFDVTDPSAPVFLITQIDSAEAFIINVCVKADCNVDITSEDPLNFDANVIFAYPDINGMIETCDLNLTEIGNYNGGVKIPVLNSLGITPQQINITNTTDDFCQTITISQDGIKAELSQYNFEIFGLDFANYSLNSISANGVMIPATDIVTDPVLGTAAVNISGAYFNGNTGTGANGDDIFNENERLTVTICYGAIGCTNEAMVLDYQSYYGCNDDICFGTTNINGAVAFTPNFGANAVANVSNVSYGSICGDDLSYTIELFSTNADPLDGLWQDLLLKYSACVGNGMEISTISVNGAPLDASIISISGSTLTLDFTSNTNGAYGLTDEDQDGFMDDLAGGQSLLIETSISIGCAESMAGCDGNLGCSLTRIEVNGKRNCGQDFQQFANLSEPISFNYGNDGTSTNAVPTTGYTIPIVELVETTCDIWEPSGTPYEFHYDFASNNIGNCENSGGIKFVATITAGGNRINNIRFESGTATYQGANVAGATGYWNIINLGGGVTDTVSYTIEIPAGDATATGHDYTFNLEFMGDCFPWDYMFLNYKVVEECLSCTDVMPCEIVRACDSAASYVRWRGCGCTCDIRSFVDTIQRCNFGYADKAMTQKLTAADVPVEDLTRFLPGDTMYTRIGFEILNAQVYYEGDYAWLFDLRYRGWEAPLIPDVYNIMFQGWYHEDISAGSFTEIGIPDCMEDYPKASRSNFYAPAMHLDNMGVEGSANFNDQYAVCPDDDVNPVYDSDIVNYRIYDASIWDDVDDLSRMWLIFGRQDGCSWTGSVADPAGSTDENTNNCHAEFLEQFPLADGDFIYMDLKIPLVRNPNVELGEINGTTVSTAQYLYPFAYTRSLTPGTCSSAVNSTTCRSTGVFEGHLPGPVSIDQDVCVTDCDSEVTYNFNLQNALPDVDDGVTPWYQNEYRPFMATEYLDFKFPSNMVYLNNGVIINPDGTETDFSPFIDTSSGNLNCITDPTGAQCCIAADPSQLASMRVADEEYYLGQTLDYYRGPISGNNTNDKCDVYELVHVPGNPFPHLSVGGAEGTCPYGIRYNLSALCPEDIESSDFQLEYQFADPYIPSLPGVEGPYNSTYLRSGNIYPSSNGFYYPDNPFGTNCTSNPGPWGCVRHYENIVSHPDDSPGSINPMRQTGTIQTGPDEFKDNSLNFPPLIATIQNILIADEAMMNEVNTYTVCADENGIDLGVHENVVTTLEIPVTVDLIDFCDEDGTPVDFDLVEARPTSNLYSILNPDLAPGECFVLQVKTELLFCPVGLDVETTTCLTTVSGCIEPSKAALFTSLGETQCDAASACYNYIAEESEIQGEWTRDACDEIELCSTFELGVGIKNVAPSVITDLEPDWWFPSGISFVPGTWRVCYPGGPGNYGVEIPIDDPIADPSLNNIYGTNFNYADDSIWNSYIDQNGLAGVASTLDSNRVEFKFEVETVCEEFVSGTSIWFKADGADPCEARVPTQFVPTKPIIVDGANPSDFAQFFVFADPLEATCGEPSTINLNFLNISPTGQTNNSMVCMDINTSTFSYMPGSIQWVTPANHMPTFDETQNGAITHVCFDIPDGIGPRQAFQVSFMFEVPEDVGCGEQDLGVQVASTVMNSNCMAQGIMCNVDVLNSVNPAVQVDFNPPIEVVDQVITVGCGNGDGTVPLCYEVVMANNSVDYTDDIKIKLIRDLNQNGILEDFDPPIDSTTHTITVLSGDSTIIMGCFDVEESLACPVFLMVMQETNCVCDAQDFYYDSIEPSASDDLGQTIAVCPGEPLKIGYCGDWDYAVSPAAGATIAPNAAGDSLCISLTDGFGLTNPVVLMVTSQTGGCMEFGFETNIFSLEGFDFGPFDAMNVCNVGCQTLDLDIPMDFVDVISVEWSPATFLDNPNSVSPMLCDPTEDITYQVTVNFMENGQMCEFTEPFPVEVEEQQVDNLFDQGSLCSMSTATFTGPAGFTNYNWIEILPSGVENPVQAGASPSYTATTAGTFYLEYFNAADICKSQSTAFDVIPCPSLTKSFVSADPTDNENEYKVTYAIDITNGSSLDTEYDLYDVPLFDGDITIISANFTSTGPGGSGPLAVPPPASPGWLIGDDVPLPGNANHTYTVCVVVEIDLEDGVDGDDTYQACGSTTGGLPTAGEGLYNEASLDMDDDGVPDDTDEACGDLPYYTLEKTLTTLTQTGAYDWTVEYEIVVCNDGGAVGTYDLDDVPSFDDDIVINGASYTSDAFLNPANPGPVTLAGNGPWTLATGQDIDPEECSTYTVTVMVTMDLENPASPGDGAYVACGETSGTDPVPGEGLYNEAQLDTNGDGMPNQTDDDCGDLPAITHVKDLTSITQTGARTWDVKYTVTVSNNGGASGMYDLSDEPLFEDDIMITGATYTSTAVANPANPGPTTLMGTGPWVLGDDMTIAAGVADVYCIIISVEMDLNSTSTPGDGSYSACGSGALNDPMAGEGLYNESSLDLNNDGTPEEVDEACGDLPYIYHEKEVSSFMANADGNHVVVYEICVYNTGGAPGDYNLFDEPIFDDDVAIISASYSCDTDPGSTLSTTIPAGGWTLLEDQTITAGATQCCEITITINADLSEGSTGDNTIDECGSTNGTVPSMNEALYNESSLDLNDDGMVDEVDEACQDLPVITHEKSLVSVTQTAADEWCAVFNITVTNDSGEDGYYDLYDSPKFDDDFTIISAEYMSTIHGTTILPNTPPMGGWQLGDDELIVANGGMHVYAITVCVSIDLASATTPGDGDYFACGEGSGGADPASGEGLFNESLLDTNNDGVADELDTVCADIPLLTMDKALVSLTQTAARDWDVVYSITVCNDGGTVGNYGLIDTPCFDNDIVINSGSYTTDAAANAGNPGPATLNTSGPTTVATAQDINQDVCQVYTLTYNVTMDLTDAMTPGDGSYTACGTGGPGVPGRAEGLLNKAAMDTNGDGDPEIEDEVCVDLPNIVHEKEITSITQTGARTWDVKYTITVDNLGGADGTYGLIDTPIFDTDIAITGTTYTSTATANAGNPGPLALAGTGPWTLAMAQSLVAGGTDTYCIVVSVEMDLNSMTTPGDGIYVACGDASGTDVSAPGEGLHNESDLDVNGDGMPDEEDEACGDLPNITHNKDIVSVVRVGDDLYDVTYQIVVENCGGATGVYGLVDTPIFDDDIAILTAVYSTNANPNAGNPGPMILAGSGPWTLATAQGLDGGCSTHTYNLVLNVYMNLDDPLTTGDGIYTDCGAASGTDDSAPGEGLHNESDLDVDGDGVADEEDEACGDLPHLTMEKTLDNLVQVGPRDWQVKYRVTVCNDGGSPSDYDLMDVPCFDDDVVINTAAYNSDAAGNPGSPGPVTLSTTGPWSLAVGQNIDPGTCQIYSLNLMVTMDLTDPMSPGDGMYTACGAGGPGAPGRSEGLLNKATLDEDGDGDPEIEDEVCVDLPNIVHEKEITSITQTGARTWDVKYTITVDNLGGADGTYGLVDTPIFDTDIAITGTTYTSTATANTGNPGPLPLVGAGPWTLAMAQSLVAGGTDTYCIVVSVEMDLTSSTTPGDGIYVACGAGSGTDDSAPGEGLHNESDLDVNGDGVADEEDEACGDLPNITHDKEIVSVVRVGDDLYDVTYQIVVENCGGATGNYGLVDTPIFDTDIVINSAVYTTNANPNAGNPGPTTLTGTGPWTLATAQSLDGACATHTYNIVVSVYMNLDDPLTTGDGVYTSCGAASGTDDSAPGEGLHNESDLDVDGDGMPDEEDEACGDLPHLTMEKDFVSLTQTGARDWTVEYSITVCNDGGDSAEYDLMDVPCFDDDVMINNVSVETDAVGNAYNPGPIVLSNTGPWGLADDQNINAGVCQEYSVTIMVTMDLTDPMSPGDNTYTACGTGGPGTSGRSEGLLNKASLDEDNDGQPEIEDEVCVDLANVVHEKTITSITQTGARTWDVKYTITVDNLGGADGTYGLVDTPIFDTDIAILGATYTSTATANAGNPGPLALAGTGPWNLAAAQTIVPGGTDTYCVVVSVEMDLTSATTPGDGIYVACGAASGTDDSAPNEGLHNESDLDVNGDGVPDEEDEACGDLPNITHEKTLTSIENNGNSNFDVTYTIVVENCGGATGTYGLVDVPTFDSDIVINAASYVTDAVPNAGNPTAFALSGTGPWTLATAQSLDGACSTHTYTLVVNVTMDLNDPLTPGDGLYTACGAANGAGDPEPGEGLYNESQLDVDGDGDSDEEDEVCGDLPHLTLDKELGTVTQTGPRSWTVTYTVEVCNDGGAAGEYNLNDIPGFDNDVVIMGASFTSDTPGAASNPGPSALANVGPWNLADDQGIIAGACHTYTLSVDVMMDLTDPDTPGDEAYSACGAGTGTGDSSPGEGLHNEAELDTNDDGIADEEDEVCADLPAITHAKELTSITQTAARSWEVKYTVTVNNFGGTAGMYDLTDQIFFDDDIEVTCARYTSDAAGNPANPGPMTLSTDPVLWTLGNDMSIDPLGVHTYCIFVCVDMDLLSATTPGDSNYDPCGASTLNGDGSPGEGLYNESYLDLDNDGVNDEEDEACGDLPNIYHNKEVISFDPMANGNHMVIYEICVYNNGGADGIYDLYDEPLFDDDIEIVNADYSCTTDPGGMLDVTMIPAGGWLLLDNQMISAGNEQCCTIEIEVDIDLSGGSSGDNTITECGAANGNGDSEPGEALHNESSLDLNDDGQPDEMDEACEDVPFITHEKTLASITQNPDDSYCAVFNITVTNMSSANGFYDLYDLPQFDDDFNILSAEYQSSVHIPTTLPTTPPATGWQLANDISLVGNGIHIYTIEICVLMDLRDPMTPGDADYTACGETPGGTDLEAGEGLFNESLLDTNDDGVPDQLDTVCGDIPYVTHTKEFLDAVRNADGTYTATFKITVDNIGGADGQYDLWDQPQFDDDFEILSAEYTTDAVGNGANPGPTALSGTGPWTFADDQPIAVGVTQCFNLTVNVDINLSDPDTVGDEIYTWCGTANGPDNPEPGEGFYNESFLDRSNDGNPEEVEETCGDVEIIDLAIRKEVVTPGPYMYGQVIEFKHTIFNQGNLDMYNVQLSEYLPAGFGFAGVAGNDPLWTQTSPSLLDYSFIAGPIAPASSVEVTLFLEILPTTGGNSDWWNYSEVTSMEDEDGEDRTDEDVDSSPDDDPDNDNQPEPGDDDDDDITGGGPDDGEDEDDHDVAGIEIFDLAQFKTTTETGPFSYGQSVPFTITIYNQGSETTTDIVILDHIPCGFMYLSSNDANGWSYDSATGIASLTYAGPLEPGDNHTVNIDLELQQCIDMDEGSFTNISEIAGGDGEDGEPGDDIDSDPDDDPDNDGDPVDDAVDDPNDEDDHDIEEVAIYDLAQIKQIETPGPYAYGDLLEFKITLCNQGNQTVQNVSIIDYIPAGYSFDVADQTQPWMADPLGAILNYAGPLLEDTCVELPIFMTLEMTSGGTDNYTNITEISYFEDEDGDEQEDADSDPNNDPDDDGDPIDDSLEDPNDEDDHDPERIEIFDLAQVKTTMAVPPFYYGDQITFTIEVFNQGNVIANNIHVLDHIPCGYNYLAVNDGTGWSYDMTSSIADITIAGPLLPGESIPVDIILEIQQCVPNSSDAFLNISEIESADDDEGNPGEDIDSDPDDDPNNDGDPNDNEIDDPNDEDDHDIEDIQIWDLAQIKEIVTAGPYAYGDLLEFKITLCNQGNQSVQNVNIIDYLPAGYGFDMADQTVTWTPSGMGNDVAHLVTGPVAPEACIEIPLFLSLEMTAGGVDDYTNISEIESFEDENGDSQEDADSDPDNNPDNDGDPIDDSMEDPNDEDDHDPETIEIFDLALTKTTTSPGPFRFGDLVEYSYNIYNQGNVGAGNLTITDYLPCGLLFDPALNPGWVMDTNTGYVSFDFVGVIAPGATHTESIFLTIDPCGTPGAWYNEGEISEATDEDGDPAEDIDSTPDTDPDNDGDPVDDAIDNPNDEDDNDPEEIPIFDLALRKSIDDRGPYLPGEIADFKIEIFNQGNVAAYNIELTDYLNVGFLFDPAINPGWTQNGDLLTFTHAGPLAPGDMHLEILRLEITVPAGATLQSWINEAEVSGAENEDGEDQTDADSVLDNDPDNDNDVQPGDDDDDVIDEHGGPGEDEDDNDVADVIVTGEIGDTVWKDIDGDGIQDPGELGVEGVIITLYDCDGNFVRSDTTDATGYYLFDLLLPGGYQLEFDISQLPQGCAWSPQNQGGDEALDSDVDADGMTECIELEGGEMNHDVDGGLLPLAKIGDFVWEDCDGNGVQDPGEGPMAFIEVRLYDAEGTLVTMTITDANGAYLFDNIYPGEYYLEFLLPNDYDFTIPAQGNSSGADSDVNGTNGDGTTSIVTLRPGECNLDAGDAGMYTCVYIGELVWFDTNENNVWDATENGVNGLKILLFKEQPDGSFEEYDFTYSGHKPGTPSDDGYFKFCAPPGKYYLEFAQPPYGMVAAMPNFGPNDSADSDVTGDNGPGTTSTFSVTCTQENCNIGAGYYPMGTIGDFVWLDSNQNGMREPGESGVGNVLVQAYDQGGNMLGMDNTDTQGKYYIDYLQATDVFLKFTPPSGYASTLPNMTNDNEDSDIDNSNGSMTTAFYNIVPGEHIPNVDAGLVFGAVPVEWMTFDGENRESFNHLEWSVTSQINVSHYEVERSINNAGNFTSIGKVLAIGESSEVIFYDYEDYDIEETGTYYYRIKQLDLNGDASFTDVVVIEIEAEIRIETTAAIYPNPLVADYTLEVELGEDAVDLSYEIYDADAKLVTRSTILAESLMQGKHIFMMSAQELTPGIYTMKISAGRSLINKKMIVVSN